MIRCPICREAASRVLWAGPDYVLRACQGCGLGFREALPDPKQYEGDAYFQEYLDNEAVFRGFFREIVLLIEEFKRPPGRLLDVGCSVGLLIDTARNRGWSVAGTDVSEWAIEYTRSRGFETYLGVLEDIPLPPRSFDVVVLNHVIEHVPDPVALLQGCRELISAGGVLFVGLPNFGSIMAQIEREHWPALQPDEHIWQFSRRTLGRLLRQNGFVPRRWQTGLQPRSYTSGLKDLVKRPLYHAATWLNGGEIMNVIAIPDEDLA